MRGGTASAFAKTGREKITDQMVGYVEHFVPASSGIRYKPTINLGVCEKTYVKTLTDAPFDADEVKFKPAVVSGNRALALASGYFNKLITLETALGRSSNADELQDMINRGVTGGSHAGAVGTTRHK